MKKIVTENDNIAAERDIQFMREALSLAGEAALAGEIPVGAVVVRHGEIIGRGRNRREGGGGAVAHAEIEAISDACRRLGGWRLSGCELYVTLEPCPMCAGALGWSQISRIVYGAPDDKRGYHLIAPAALHPKTEVVARVLEEDCREMMRRFFAKKRG